MWRMPFSLLILAVVAGCAGGPPHEMPPARPAVHLAPAAVTSANFGDARPNAHWAGHAPDTHAVHGIDVSRYQAAGSIDWPVARANGVNFAFIKATEGGDRADEAFKAHWRGAGNAGVARGAYHFFYHCRPAAEQARWFIRHVPRTRGALPPVLDIEWTPFSPTCRIRRDARTIRREAEIFIDLVARHYGQRPILYTTIDFFRDNEMQKVRGADFWLRAVARHPDGLYAGHRWLFWQYTSTGLVPGIRGEVDINAFAGSADAWRRWLASRTHGASLSRSGQ